MLSLEYFGVVARERSVNRAAKILHTSQPAVSRRIKQLEHELKASLFERSATGVVLTPAGRALARYADEIRRLTDEAGHIVKKVSHQPGKAVRIGFFAPATQMLLSLMRRLHCEHPEIEVEPFEASRTELFESVRKGEVDLALPGIVCPKLLSEFDGIRVPSPGWAYVLPEDHRLAHRKRIYIAELKDEVFVSLDENEFAGYNSLLNEHCRLAGFSPHISVYAHTWNEAIAYVLSKHGVSVVPISAIAIPLASVLKVIPAENHPPWYALWKPSNGNPHLRPVIEILMNRGCSSWGSVKRMLPALGISRIRPGTRKPRLTSRISTSP
jgi:LysR family transcriptional activator of glutamate synthase operon